MRKPEGMLRLNGQVCELTDLPIADQFDIVSVSRLLMRVSQLPLFNNIVVLAKDPSERFLQIEINWTDGSGKEMSQTEWISVEELKNLDS